MPDNIGSTKGAYTLAGGKDRRGMMTNDGSKWESTKEPHTVPRDALIRPKDPGEGHTAS